MDLYPREKGALKIQLNDSKYFRLPFDIALSRLYNKRMNSKKAESTRRGVKITHHETEDI